MHLKRDARFIISVTTLIGLVLVPAVMVSFLAHTGPLSSPGAEQVADTRERVRLTPAEQDAIAMEMRTMLRSLSDIMQGLISGDLVKAEKAARASGVALPVDPGLEKKLPPHFLQLSVRTHKRFVGLADAIKEGAARDAVLRRVAAITASCVTCHDRYRFDERRE
jgi:hypothetical protein